MRTDSRGPPADRKATVGVPCAAASTTTSPQPSFTEGIRAPGPGQQPVLGHVVDPARVHRVGDPEPLRLRPQLASQ